MHHTFHAMPGSAAMAAIALLILLPGCATNRNDVPVLPAQQNTSATAPLRVPMPAAGSKAARRATAAGHSPRRGAAPACKVRGDSVAWEYRAGACRNGFAHGAGEAVSVDGQRQYRGEFRDGAFHGQGNYDWGNGVQYQGGFVRGAKSGHGTIVYAGNRKYTGEFLNNVYHGRGAYTEAGVLAYEGEFRHGRFNGRGTYTWANGDRYSGQFHDDLMEGEGEYLRANGEKYTGSFRQNRRDGMGAYVWPNGDRYQGAFRDDEMNGAGTYYHADGTKFAGNFQNGRKHGPGRLVSAAGEFRQQWDRGNKVAEERLSPASEDARAPAATTVSR